ncbi:MAG TPA: choice-of-anchor Q domain-containing protein [Baekduia sp.]|nr:choice-of-anchor Q domain-containing protein [Baekduia sp.]
MPRLALALSLSAIALGVLTAGSAAAATTRYAAPTAQPKASDCTNVADPCPLTGALDQAQAGDTISLLVGTYDVPATLPPVPLRWEPTDRRTRPKLTSGGAAPTIALGPAQSGSVFDGVAIDKTQVMTLEPSATPALQVGPGVAATVRATVIQGNVCVDAPEAGEVTIDDSALTSPADSTCANLGVRSTLRHSTVDRIGVLNKATVPASLVTTGAVEDTQVDGGLQLVGPAAVARRVRASGWTAIWGEGLVVDTLARGGNGAAIAADAPQGGTLRVINTTAVATGAPALLARVRSATPPIAPNVLEVSNAIARGGPSDIEATDIALCRIEQPCAPGEIAIDHSNFAVRTPAANAPGRGVITEGTGNQSADPRFVNPGTGDFHLRAGSPAIDAGTSRGAALALDLDGHPRAQGAALDLGAYETPAPAAAGGSGGPGSGASGGADRKAPILGRLHLLHARFRVGARATAITTTTSEPGHITVAVQQRIAGRRNGGRCVTRAPKKAPHCTRWVQRGPVLTRRVAAPGRVTVAFSGRIGTRRLSPGRYRFAVTATDAAGNRSRVRTIGFTVIAARA